MRLKALQNMLLRRIQYSVFPMRTCHCLRKMCVVRDKMSAVPEALRTSDESVFFVEMHSRNVCNTSYDCFINISHDTVRKQVNTRSKRSGVVTRETIVTWTTELLFPQRTSWISRNDRYAMNVRHMSTLLIPCGDTLHTFQKLLFGWPHQIA